MIDDIGDWAWHAAYKPQEEECPGRGGILHALVAHVGAGHRAVACIEWKKIRKFRAGDHRAPETRNVLGVALDADELGCDALVFARDRDRDIEREKDIELGIEAADAMFSQLRIVGGTANEECEAWLLALLGDTSAESHADAKTMLAELHGIDHRGAKRNVVADADLTRLPAGCPSLYALLEPVLLGRLVASMIRVYDRADVARDGDGVARRDPVGASLRGRAGRDGDRVWLLGAKDGRPPWAVAA